MKKSLLLPLLVIALLLSNHVQAFQSNDTSMITAGGTITEIVYELGFGSAIIATVITSTYPASMQQLPSIGYRNQIKAEGILALGPDLLLIETGYLNPDVVAQLKSAGLEIHQFDKPTDVSGTYRIIRELANFLKVPEKGKALTKQLDKDIEALDAYTAGLSKKPKMAFVMARGLENVFVAGEDTFAESLLKMAAIESVGKGFNDFIPLTPEALVSMNPEYLLFFESSLRSLGGKEAVKNIRGV